MDSDLGSISYNDDGKYKKDIFVRHFLSDFEKLLFAETYIKELKALLHKAEVDLENHKADNVVLLERVERKNNELKEFTKRHKGELLEIKKDAHVQQLLHQLKLCQASNRKQKDTIGDLISKIKR